MKKLERLSGRNKCRKYFKKGISPIIVQLSLVLLVIVGIALVFISISSFFYGFKDKSSSENVDRQLGIIDYDENSENINNSICIGDKEKCEAGTCIGKWECNEWSECSSKFDLSDVLTGEIVKGGYKERKCEDFSNCFTDKIERVQCNMTLRVTSKKVKFCEENYVEIYEQDTNELISRVKETEIVNFTNFSRLDISFIVAASGDYCSYCHNNIQDYDEEDVDCGGENCRECLPKYTFFDWLFYIVFISWMLLSILLLLLLIKLRRSKLI